MKQIYTNAIKQDFNMFDFRREPITITSLERSITFQIIFVQETPHDGGAYTGDNNSLEDSVKIFHSWSLVTKFSYKKYSPTAKWEYVIIIYI